MLPQLSRLKPYAQTGRHFAFAGIFGLLIAGLILTNAKSQEESPKTETGLRGILPDLVPEDLLDEKFESLSGNWADWGQETAALAASLYEGEDLDVAGQRKVIEELESRLRVMNRALKDSRYRSIQTQLNTFYGRLSRRVELSKAILDTFDADPAETRKIAVEKLHLPIVNAVTSLKADLGKIVNGKAWLPYVKADELAKLAKDKAESEAALPVYEAVAQKLAAREQLEDQSQKDFLSRPAFLKLQQSLEDYVELAQAPLVEIPQTRKTMAELVNVVEAYERHSEAASAASIRDAYRNLSQTMPDGGKALAEVIRTNYLNYNFKIAASENFLNRFVRSQRNRQAPVRDQVAGANVYGQSTTNVSTEVDVVPSQNGARLEMVLSGTTQSNTAGVTSQATVYTQGYHRFFGRKPVNFYGDVLTTQPATLSVQPNNRTTGVSTSYDGIPFLGSYARSKARSIAAQKRGQGEAVARQRIESQVLPEFNSNVEQVVSEANGRLNSGLKTRLRGLDLEPVYNQAHSTSQHLFLNCQILNQNEVSGDAPNIVGVPANGVAFSMHESLLNNMADRMNFAGRTMTDEEIREEIEKFMTALTGDPVSLSDKPLEKLEENYDGDEEGSARAFIFADKDPIRFRLANGLIYLILRAGFEREGQEPITPKLITIPLEYSIAGDKIAIKTGVVEVAPIPGTDYSRTALLTRGVIRKKIERSLPDRERSRDLRIERENGSVMVVKINRFHSMNGWLTIEAN